MTPPETLAERLRKMIHVEFGMDLPTVSQRAAAEALAWVEERLPKVEEVGDCWFLTKYPTYKGALSKRGVDEYNRCATALLALIRERLT